MPRTAGRLEAGGDPALADVLAGALRAAQTDRDTAASLTHPFHTYPARMHPATARVLVELVGEGAPRTAPLVDPFCGSGTVLVETRAAGIRAIGVDLNPLAVLVARAKTWTVPARRRLRDAAHDIAGTVLAAGKAARRANAEDAPRRTPRGFDPNARDRRLAAWFAPHVRRELELIAARIDELRARDGELADVLTACLSAVLYKVSSRTSDTDSTWVAREVPRGGAARLFARRAELLVAGLDDLARERGAPPEVFELATIRRHVRLRRAPAAPLRLPRAATPRLHRRRDRRAPELRARGQRGPGVAWSARRQPRGDRERPPLGPPRRAGDRRLLRARSRDVGAR
jgi:hypothetical protein